MRIRDKIGLEHQGLTEHGPFNIVAFGDSVTHGCVGPGEFDYESVYWTACAESSWRCGTICPSTP